jgi:hypothetical protein
MGRFPVLSSSDKPDYPTDGRCPVCSKGFTNGFAYLACGALLLTEDEQDSIFTDKLRAFFDVGFHGRESDMTDSSNISIVADLYEGQFEMCWCSVACMRKWLFEVLDEVERRADPRRKTSD